MMQKFNLHTHTVRCGHASGTEEELVLAAIESGYAALGFSEHLPFDDWPSLTYRIPMEEIEAYLETCQRLKEKYKDKIQIYTGFETEYFPDQLDWIKTMHQQVDYLILGQHSYFRGFVDCFEEPYCYGDYFRKNIEMMIEGLNTGLFCYLAHPDYVFLSDAEWKEEHIEGFRALAQCAKANNVPVEINLKGTLYGKKHYDSIETWHYPNQKVIEIFKEAGCRFVFGYDVHSSEMLKNRAIENEVKESFEPLNLEYITEIDEILNSSQR